MFFLIFILSVFSHIGFGGMISPTTYITITAAQRIHVSTPADATGTPADATGTPADATGTSVYETGTPADATGTPADATGTPADATGTPADATGTPADAASTPAYTTGTPADATGTSVYETGTPADATGTPAYAADTSVYATGTPADATGTPAYVADTSVYALFTTTSPSPTTTTAAVTFAPELASAKDTTTTTPATSSPIIITSPTTSSLEEDAYKACIESEKISWPGWDIDQANWSDLKFKDNLFDFCRQKKQLMDNLDENCISELREFRKLEKPEIAAKDADKKTYSEAKKEFNDCKDKWDEILNTEYGKGDCREEVKKKYETTEAFEKEEEEEEESDPDSTKLKSLKKEAEEAKRKLKSCKEQKGYTKGNERCSEAAKDLKNVTQEFNRSCGELGGGAESCIRSLRSCSECDNPNLDSEAVDCVRLRETMFCPELATEILEDLKEEKEDFEEKTEDLEEKMETLKEDKSQLEAELSDEKLAFEADIEEFRTKEEELKEELEVNFKNIKAEIKAAFEAARAKILAEIDKSDQLQYQLSNTIEEAHRKYRRERQKIYKGCEIQAKEKLSEYRKARKIAIAKGRFKRESIFQALSENRVTFAQKDDKKFSGYYTACIKEIRHLVDALREDLQFELRKIEQQKQMIIKQLESMKSQMHALANEARAKEQTTVHDYITQLSKITEKIQKGVDSRTNVYTQKSFQLGQQITRKAHEINQTQSILIETQHKFNHNQEMRNRLRSAGASDEDKSSQLADASSNHNNLIEEWDSAFQICDCKLGDFKKDEEARECKQIKRAGRLVEPDHDNLRNPRRSEWPRSHQNGEAIE